MEVAEDIAALIPISIALVALVIGLSSVLVGYAHKAEANDLHRFALSAAERVAYPRGMVIMESELAGCGWAVNSSEYETRMSVRNLETGQTWGCGREGNYSVTVAVPVLVRGSKDYAGKVTAEVAR